MKVRMPRKRVVVVVAAAMALALGGGVAYAYWTAGGSGNGTAAVASGSTDVVVVQDSTVTGLTPGGSPQELNGHFTNTNTAAVHVASLGATVSIDTVHAAAGCLAADFALANFPIVPTLGWDVATNGSTTWGDATTTIALTDTPSVNQDACKGATVTLTYAAAGV